jgi:hypothetical protein
MCYNASHSAVRKIESRHHSCSHVSLAFSRLVLVPICIVGACSLLTVLSGFAIKDRPPLAPKQVLRASFAYCHNLTVRGNIFKVLPRVAVCDGYPPRSRFPVFDSMAELSPASRQILIKSVLWHKCSSLEKGISGVLGPYKVVGPLLMHIYSPETHEQTIQLVAGEVTI